MPVLDFADLTSDDEEETTLVMGSWSYVGTGWDNDGDTALALARVGSATSRTSRAVISGALGWAVREGALRFNPTREVRRLSGSPRRRPRALTEQERAAWFLAVTRDPRSVSRDLPDLSAFMLATGLRIGEVVAVLWSEVDLGAATVEVTSTLIPVTGEGLIRKPTKSAAGQRLLPLPQWCVSMLRRRAEVGVGRMSRSSARWMVASGSRAR